MDALVVNLFDASGAVYLNRASKSENTMDWQPDEEQVIQLLDEAFPKREWVQPNDLHKKLGITQERLGAIVRLLHAHRLLEIRLTGLSPTDKAVEEWRRILAARAAAEKERRNWYKRARNWCETNRVVATILILIAVVLTLNGLKDFVQFLWNLCHQGVPPTP